VEDDDRDEHWEDIKVKKDVNQGRADAIEEHAEEDNRFARFFPRKDFYARK
jgi:hypothetical protein